MCLKHFRNTVFQTEPDRRITAPQVQSSCYAFGDTSQSNSQQNFTHLNHVITTIFDEDTTMSHTAMHSDCADICSSCSTICYSTALNHCLEMGGKHVEPEHFKLMLNCAKICETSACLELSGSSFSAQLCGICADICEACAKSCEEVGEMEACVEACRKCAASCRQMAA
jgi:hypothetical protein